MTSQPGTSERTGLPSPVGIELGAEHPLDRPRVVVALRDELLALERWLTEQERSASALVGTAHPSRRASALNLAHYLALRSDDRRPLQEQLAALGLSSLGRAESAVLSSVHAVVRVLARLTACDHLVTSAPPALDLARGRTLLAEHADAVLGPCPPQRPVRIMVTMPTEAAVDAGFVEDCVAAGMDIMRINCAHDDAEAWQAMVTHLRRAEARFGHRCRVLMDLGGPKIRTGPIAGDEGAIVLAEGDELVLSRRRTEGAADGGPKPPRIGCTLPDAMARIAVGHRVWFDDGKLGGTVTRVDGDDVTVRIELAKANGSRLRADRGINLPDTPITVPALSETDLADLEVAVGLADLIGLSFVRAPEDIEALVERLEMLRATHLGIVLKIETREGFDRLPELLLTAMRTPASGVMIARGDLAVECGYERLAEVQEEILWLCEASHTPVIWATQVLDTLAKKGRPTRSEVTDAAMAERAECVMLNKGPHIRRAVEFLDGVLRRMAAHQRKKTPTLRPLAVARRFNSLRGFTVEHEGFAVPFDESDGDAEVTVEARTSRRGRTGRAP